MTSSQAPRAWRDSLRASAPAITAIVVAIGVVAVVGASVGGSGREVARPAPVPVELAAAVPFPATDTTNAPDHTHLPDDGTSAETSAHDHTHSTAGSATPAAHHHTAATTPGDTTPAAHHHTGTTIPGDTTPTTAHHHGDPPPDGTTTPTTGGHAHTGDPVQLADLPADLRTQIIAVRDWALQYPTTADATAAGYVQATIYFPGIAAHYLNFSLLDGTFDPAHPEVLLYDADGALVGVNYIVFSGATPPEGFAGDYDQWHEHPTLCQSNSTGLIIAGEETSAAACEAMGGHQISFKGYWLLHVWCIPGHESPDGIFSHANSTLT